MSSNETSLLTPNATKTQRALEQACAKVYQKDVPIKHLWDPWRCPVWLLPWLAWALSVDEFDSSWPEQIKRQVITDSIPVHRKKGTAGAVRQALAGLDAEIELTEWWQNGSVPYTAQLTAFARNNLNQGGDTLLSPELMAQMWRIVAATKPARTPIDFSVGVQSDGGLSVAAGATSTSINRVAIAPVVDNSLDVSTVNVAAGATSTSVNRVSMAPTPDNTLGASPVFVQSGSAPIQINRVRMSM